ncbi:PREDICTED: maltase A3-like [Diuraphis noxia]|uniref:maltase A3-like n=1 Tax=Diuraphis noxia TaxID=143948 RepID=UPI0007635A98|nr:PREDICTED: maltase A3-like [Diuraphis noxia]
MIYSCFNTKMSLFTFVCFIVLGVVAGNEGIFKLQNVEKYSDSIRSAKILIDSFKDQHNLENNDIENKVESISKKFKVQEFFNKKNKTKLDWWQTGIIYEIYPRSFKDTTDTGIGDLRGIIEKIPYLKFLGISAIWITPIYTSPGFDMGYDIKDYRGIDELMGSMEDFDELTSKLHENGIKIILDFVPNHTSDEHEWFVKSVQRIEPYTDYYVWADAKYVNDTRQTPNNWNSIFGDTIWEWSEERQQYYLHQFYKQQPDLNFWNPLVREEMKDLLRFWMDKGVDGFRMDAIPNLYERQDLLDAPEHYGFPEKSGYTEAIDETFYEVNDWRALTEEYKKKDGNTRILLIETYLSPIETMKFYGNETNYGAHLPLNIVLVGLNHQPAREYIDKITEWMSNLPSGAWSSWTIGNHDLNPRPASRYGLEIIDGIFMVQFLLPGTPILYMGDELAMTDLYLREDQMSPYSIRSGNIRERSRTPFQWNSSPQAGFTNHPKPWLPVNPNYVTINVDNELNAKRSHLKIFKEIMDLRKLDAFRTGDLELYEISEYVFAFSRSNSFFKTYFIVLNLGSEIEIVDLTKFKKIISSKLTVKISSLFAEQKNGDIVSSKSIHLRPSSALVLESSFY